MGRRIAFSPGKLQELVHENGQPDDVALDPSQELSGIVAGTGQIDGDVEPGQWRAELVRHILKQPAFSR